MKQLSVDHAAKMVGVSSATIRNWEKAGHIVSARTRPLAFSESAVLSLKSQLGSGSLQKLRTRANKAHSEGNILPSEYAADSKLVGNIQSIIELVKHNQLKVEGVLFVAALRLLVADGEMIQESTMDIFAPNSFVAWRRDSTRIEMEQWRKSLGEISNNHLYSICYDLISSAEGDDYLGLLYQSLSVEGQKSEGGAYYTPSSVVEDSLRQCANPKFKTFLDPCCGTGKYLIYAAKLLQFRPESIYGFDIDALAVQLARINLLRAFKQHDFSPHIHCLDALEALANGEMFCKTNALIGKIDVIATNPPWGAYKNGGVLPQFSPQIKSGETFSMFLAKSVSLLSEGGRLSFVLPESILKIKTHADIRKFLLNQGIISRIVKLGRQFSGVFTPVIRLDFIKGKQIPSGLISIEDEQAVFSIEQARFLANDNYAFDIDVGDKDATLLSRLYSSHHVTLVNNAEWALGIVTGDNKKYILDNCEENTEAVFRGADVHPFRLSESKSFIHFTPDRFQQVAPERFFRAPEKLVYRFISKKLVFAYDEKQSLTLNSANILIPHLPGMSIKVALAYLNSSVFQYVFRKKFSTHKVLKGDLEKLPFPVITRQLHDQLEGSVEAILQGRGSYEEMDELVFAAFNLSSEEVASIRREVRN